VNAGSNEISVFSVQADGLQRVTKVRSGGVRPISLTVHGKLLYVLNEGGTSPNIVGFRISNAGELTRLANSLRTLPSGVMADPGQIAFNPNGRTLVLTEKGTDQIVTYRVRLDGRTEPPIVMPSNGATPFGIAFDGLGHVFVAEANGGLAGAASLSSYDFLPGGILETISESVPDGQTYAGRVVVTHDLQFVFVSNRRSSQISTYQLAEDGSIELLHSAAGPLSDVARPIDMALSRDGQNLYAYLGNPHRIVVFEINPDGTLNRRRSESIVPGGAQGLAAF
jgi:6-phosphogluconolactonase (cycloisomerase 2 family)